MACLIKVLRLNRILKKRAFNHRPTLKVPRHPTFQCCWTSTFCATTLSRPAEQLKTKTKNSAAFCEMLDNTSNKKVAKLSIHTNSGRLWIRSTKRQNLNRSRSDCGKSNLRRTKFCSRNRPWLSTLRTSPRRVSLLRGHSSLHSEQRLLPKTVQSSL